MDLALHACLEELWPPVGKYLELIDSMLATGFPAGTDSSSRCVVAKPVLNFAALLAIGHTFPWVTGALVPVRNDWLFLEVRDGHWAFIRSTGECGMVPPGDDS